MIETGGGERKGMFQARHMTFAALMLACALVAVLGYQNRELAAGNRQLVERSMAPEVGEWLPSIAARDLDGDPVGIAGAGSTQALYFFSPSCPYCGASAPSVRALHERLRQGAGVGLVGLAKSPEPELRAHLSQHGLRFPVVRLTPKQSHLLAVRAVPTLLLVGADGKILYAHAGVINGKTTDEVVSLIARRAKELPSGRMADAKEDGT